MACRGAQPGRWPGEHRGTGPLVEAAWVRERLDDPGLAIVDCRWQLGEPGAGERDYLEGHIPGAAFLDVDADLSAPPGKGGRHPLPNLGDFQTAARRAGISDSSVVVAHGQGAARLWWLLRHFGHPEVSVLERWDGPWRSGPQEIAPGDFTAQRLDEDAVTAEQIRGGRYVLLDARAPERFRGEVEPIDPVAGHIPGARNLPHEEIAPGGRLLPAEELRERMPDGEFVAYCGSGVTSCTLLLAAAVAGRGPGLLYPGSWSEWCALQ